MFDVVDSIKVGMLLVARNTFEYPSGGKALVKGLPYKVTSIEDNGFTIKTSIGTEAKFRFSALLDYFSHTWTE